MMDFFFSRGCKSPSLIILKYYDRQIVHRCGKARLSSLVFLFLKKNIITLRPNSTRCSLKEVFLIPSFSSQAHVVETVHSCRNVEVEQQTKRVDQRSSPSEYTQDTARMQMSATPPKKVATSQNGIIVFGTLYVLQRLCLLSVFIVLRRLIGVFSLWF